MSVRPYRGSFEPVGVALPVTSHIEPLAAETMTWRIARTQWLTASVSYVVAISAGQCITAGNR